MSEQKTDVIIVGNSDWHGLWFQRQQFACAFAARGHRVYYLTKTLQQWPTFDHFKRRFFFDSNRLHNRSHTPKNVHIVKPIWLPPSRSLRQINRILIKRTVSQLDISSPVVITYIPSYNILDFISMVRPSRVVYINVHNYNADVVMADLLRSEKEVIQRADVLFADSTFNMKRVSKLAEGRPVYPALPGVDYAEFKEAYRGDERQCKKTLYYFGGIGPHLDISLYAALAERLNVVFIGVISPAVRSQIPKNITVHPPVPVSELPLLLKNADILGLFYIKSLYIDGVIPAKFFECLATGKPVLVSGLDEAIPYTDVVYDINASYERAQQVIHILSETETPDKIARRNTIAREADWSNRFSSLVNHLKLPR